MSYFIDDENSKDLFLGYSVAAIRLKKQLDEINIVVDNITDADGLAVGTPSGFVEKTLKNLISGIYTIEDRKLYKLLAMLADTEKIYLEPSALAGMPRVINLLQCNTREEFLKKNGLNNNMTNATHITWTTGGSLVPQDIMQEYYKKEGASE